MIRFFIFSLSVIFLPSCSLVVDAVDISRRRSQAVAQGTTIQGKGFTIKAPASGLYPVLNTPGKGGVTFRPTDPQFDGLVYFVTPFLQAQVETTQQALIQWNLVAARKGIQAKVLEQKETQYRGFPATEALVEILQGPGGHIVSVLVVKSATGFFVLNRGDRFNNSQLRAKSIERCRAGMKQLKDATTIQ